MKIRNKTKELRMQLLRLAVVWVVGRAAGWLWGLDGRTSRRHQRARCGKDVRIQVHECGGPALVHAADGSRPLRKVMLRADRPEEAGEVIADPP